MVYENFRTYVLTPKLSYTDRTEVGKTYLWQISSPRSLSPEFEVEELMFKDRWDVTLGTRASRNKLGLYLSIYIFVELFLYVHNEIV